MNLGKRMKRSAYFLFTVPAVLLYLIFFAFPVVSGIYYSLTDWNGISPTYQFIGLQNYLSAFQDKLTMAAVGRTFWYTIVMTLLVTALATLLAVLLNQKLKLHSFWRVTYFFPAVMSSITIGLIFNQIYYHVVPMGARRWASRFCPKTRSPIAIWPCGPSCSFRSGRKRLCPRC